MRLRVLAAIALMALLAGCAAKKPPRCTGDFTPLPSNTHPHGEAHE